MKLTLIESTTGIHRTFVGGSEDMSIGYFLSKISELYQYDRKRVKLLFMT
jgi:hypothetical protein